MYALPCLLLLSFAIAITGSTDPRIVGGTNAPQGKHPYAASLKKNGAHYCGGSILNSRFILTAAHCIDKQSPSKFRVSVGTIYASRHGDSYAVDEFIPHRNYNQKSGLHDIGLVRVKKDIAFYKHVQPITLPYTCYVPEGKNVTVIGWGKISDKGRLPNNLQEVNLKTISQATCRSWISDVEDTQICTLTKYGEGVCSGDSGGPLIADGTQIGLVSYGFPCALGIPDVYTRICPYKLWIYDHIQK